MNWSRLLAFDLDFYGGIYLAPLGTAPDLDHIEELEYDGDLLLPLAPGFEEPLKLTVRPGETVHAGEIVAENTQGLCLRAPCPGIVQGLETAWVGGCSERPVVCLRPTASAGVARQGTTAAADDPRRAAVLTPSADQFDAVRRTLADAGMLLPEGMQPLGDLLARAQHEPVHAVVANAAPLEPSLNGPLAVLRRWPEQVFAGLAILKTVFQAQTAVVAYPAHFDFVRDTAARWQVRCVPVGEKYPQARAGSVRRTLRTMGILRGRRGRSGRALVFDLQTIRQVERLILAGEYPRRRLVTVAGDGVERPGHFLAPVGMPLRPLLDRAGLKPDAEYVLEGGSMAGRSVDPDGAVIAPTSEPFTVVHHSPNPQPHRCIRCGWCLEDCPARIDPAQLLHLAETGQFERACAIGLMQCVECGICSYTCPSRLRIMDHIVMMKRHCTRRRAQETLS